MQVISKASDEGISFLGDKEGLVTRAYRDSGGVITIGYGFTMGSKIFADYWMQTRGHALRMGDTITRAESNKLLKALVNEEYGSAVSRKLKPTAQHVFDGSTSGVFNMGTGSLDWKWAKALAAGDIALGARLLLTTAITAAGRPLLGLKRRRAAESHLILTGEYGTVSSTSPSAHSITVEEIREYQRQLKELGFYSGDIDGVKGPLTKGAVENFQRAHGLRVDGNVGNATRSTLARALDAKLRNTTATGGGLATGTGSTAVLDGTSPLTVVLVAVGVFIIISVGFWLWSNRGRVTGQRTMS